MISKTHKSIFVFLTLLILFEGMYFANVQKTNRIKAAQELLRQEKIQAKYDAYKDLLLSAQSVIVIDSTRQDTLYAVNESMPLPIASITKIMTAIVAEQVLDQKETITVSPRALQEQGEYSLGINEVWKSQDLLKFMLVVSSNDAADAVAETVEEKQKKSDTGTLSFVFSMNKTAETIGMVQTHFYNPSGLDVDQKNPGATSTVIDTAKMMEFGYTHYPELFSATAEPKLILKSVTGISHEALNTDDLIGVIPGIVLSKTGTTNLAGANLAVIAMIADKPYTFVILGATDEERFNDMKKLIDATRKFVTSDVYKNIILK